MAKEFYSLEENGEKRIVAEFYNFSEMTSLWRDFGVGYLESREKEVVDIMMVLYDEEEAMRTYVESERYDEKIETARRLIDVGKFSLEDIAAGTGLTIDKVREIANLQPI